MSDQPSAENDYINHSRCDHPERCSHGCPDAATLADLIRQRSSTGAEKDQQPTWTRADHEARADRLKPLAEHLRLGHDIPDDERRYRDTWLHIALLADEWFEQQRADWEWGVTTDADGLGITRSTGDEESARRVASWANRGETRTVMRRSRGHWTQAPDVVVPHEPEVATKTSGEPVDLLAALQRSIDAAKASENRTPPAGGDDRG